MGANNTRVAQSNASITRSERNGQRSGGPFNRYEQFIPNSYNLRREYSIDDPPKRVTLLTHALKKFRAGRDTTETTSRARVSALSVGERENKNYCNFIRLIF